MPDASDRESDDAVDVLRWAQVLTDFQDSAARREPVSEEERTLVLELAGALKSFGQSPAVVLMKSVIAEEALRDRLGIAPDDNRWPTVQQIAPLVSGPRNDCPWPACDFVRAPSVLDRLILLRQQNAPWDGRANPNREALRESERALWEPDAPEQLWKLRLFLGANRSMAEDWAKKTELDQLTEALRFNAGRSGRRPARALEYMVEKWLSVVFRSFFGILKRAQRELPKSLCREDEIREDLETRGFPPFFIERLAQEIAEHRHRRRDPLTLEDRAALMTVELEGKRGDYGLPEPLSPKYSMGDEDITQPVIVATRKPARKPLPTPEAVKLYQKALERAVSRARSRVRRVKAIWEAAQPASDN